MEQRIVWREQEWSNTYTQQFSGATAGLGSANIFFSVLLCSPFPLYDSCCQRSGHEIGYNTTTTAVFAAAPAAQLKLGEEASGDEGYGNVNTKRGEDRRGAHGIHLEENLVTNGAFPSFFHFSERLVSSAFPLGKVTQATTSKTSTEEGLMLLYRTVPLL